MVVWKRPRERLREPRQRRGQGLRPRKQVGKMLFKIEMQPTGPGSLEVQPRGPSRPPAPPLSLRRTGPGRSRPFPLRSPGGGALWPRQRGQSGSPGESISPVKTVRKKERKKNFISLHQKQQKPQNLQSKADCLRQWGKQRPGYSSEEKEVKTQGRALP